MNHFIRFRSVATILALLVTNALSGSGPTISGSTISGSTIFGSTISGSTIAAASNNQPGAGAVSSVAAASSNLSSPQAAELRAAGQRNASGATHAKPLTGKAVTITIDALTNRHPISTYVYGGAYPQDAATIADSGLTEVRWGGDATSTYNWQLET
jgi:hypothetical protein